MAKSYLSKGKPALEVSINTEKDDPVIFKTSGVSTKVLSLRKCSDDEESTVTSGSETGAGNKGDFSRPLPRTFPIHQTEKLSTRSLFNEVFRRVFSV